ncbi:MAG: hypothetical protein J6Y60_03735 [Treponema sp.]|nr:hypothetical protein [Treponema sp.]
MEKFGYDYNIAHLMDDGQFLEGRKPDISYLIDKIQENTEYEITIDWFGGYLIVYTIYKNGVFEVLNEDYSKY